MTSPVSRVGLLADILQAVRTMTIDELEWVLSVINESEFRDIPEVDE